MVETSPVWSQGTRPVPDLWLLLHMISCRRLKPIMHIKTQIPCDFCPASALNTHVVSQCGGGTCSEYVSGTINTQNFLRFSQMKCGL